MKVLMLAMAILLSIKVHAHPLDLGYLEVKIDLHSHVITMNLDINPHTIPHKANWQSMLPVTNCTHISSESSNISESTQRITGKFNCLQDLKIYTMTFKNFESLPPDFQMLGRQIVDGEESTFILNQKSPELMITNAVPASFTQFALMGIKHIGATPDQWAGTIPEGIDHVLFVVALVLLGGSLRRTIKIVSGFTLGHSISLILATFGIVKIPPAFIEPAIALSIVYVAVEALLLKKSNHRWMVAAFFGIIHGFGFATALEGLKLSTPKLIEALVAFNLGVELGQVAIVIIIAPIFLFLASKRPIYFSATSRVTSLAIALLGSYWFIERTFY